MQVFLWKAREALHVAGLSRRRQPNSSAVRSYYSVHQAMNGLYGPDFPTRHGEIRRPAVLGRLALSAEDAVVLERLYNARRTADYGDEQISPGTAEACWLDAKAVLRKLGVLKP